jgi:hypothetical protein
MVGSNEDLGRSRRPGAEDQRWSSTGRVLDGRTIRRSGDAVCSLHHARGDEEHGFLGLALKPRSAVYQWFDIKTTGTIFSSLASKPVAMIFSGLTSKSVARVFRFGPQNRQLRFVIWASKSLQRFLGLGLKTK